jgi:hypothetical protein
MIRKSFVVPSSVSEKQHNFTAMYSVQETLAAKKLHFTQSEENSGVYSQIHLELRSFIIVKRN